MKKFLEVVFSIIVMGSIVLMFVGAIDADIQYQDTKVEKHFEMLEKK
ncbi:MAG: hypothetical protein RR744_07925 [Cellulosilyticaceae bacterium]